MIRVVIDTNIFISALLQPNGLPAQVLLLALASENVHLCGGADIYAEYEAVIRRPRFMRSESEIANALRAIRERAQWVKPSEKVRACSDPDNDVFLECARAAQAHFLVTGNLKHFPLDGHQDRDCAPVCGRPGRGSALATRLQEVVIPELRGSEMIRAIGVSAKSLSLHPLCDPSAPRDHCFIETLNVRAPILTTDWSQPRFKPQRLICRQARPASVS